MKNINEIDTWKQSFGLLPIHLTPQPEDENKYILLNGGYGDFCINIDNVEENPEKYNTLAWSSNTKNFVVLGNDKVSIYNWEKDKKEDIKKIQVEGNFEKFYNYLVSNSHKSDKDVVPFVIDIFKQFRNITREKNNANEALNLLFVLLAGLEDNLKIDFDKWGLSEIEIHPNFEKYLERFRKGSLNITPDLELVIRHSAGVLFQEAQKEVLFFDSQWIDLWGNYSSKLKTEKIFYSSIHYTPPYLARTIVENAIKKLEDLNNKPSIKILDPACGSSEFLMEALKQLYEKGYTGNVQIIGWDSSETAINTSRFLLTYENRTIWGNKLKLTLKPVENSLTENWDKDYDLILMNPPFVSWELLGKNSRDAVKDVLPGISGKPNIASAFFFKAIQSLKYDGAIGCVIPSSLLTLDAYKKLRNKIYDIVNIDLIGKLGNFVFEDALTDVSLIVGHKPKSINSPYVLWTKNERGVAQDALRSLRKMFSSNNYTIDEKEYSIYQPTKFPIAEENWKPISLRENKLYKTVERYVSEGKLVRVQDIFNVQQGIRTGNNLVFKVSASEFENLPNGEKNYFKPVVDNESIKNGLMQKKNYVWFPYNEQGLIINSEAELEKNVSDYYNNKLKPYKKDLEKRAINNLLKWWQLNRHRTWLEKQEPRLVSTEFGKSDSFAFDSIGEFVVERGNAWLPKKYFKDKDLYYFYLALFSSPFFDKLLSIYSRQLAGGKWYDLGKKFTSKIPIPAVIIDKSFTDENNLINNESAIFQTLVQFGKEISRGELFNKFELDSFVDKYIYNVDFKNE